MNRPFLVALLGAAALIPAAAHAQKAQTYTVQVGVTQPANATTRKSTQDAGLAVGLGVSLPTTGTDGVYSIDGLYSQSKGHGNSLETTGFYLTERIPVGGKKSGSKTYYGAGLGYAHTRLKTLVAEAGTTPVAASNSHDGFGFRLLAGTALSGGLNLEVGYNFNPGVTVAGTKYKTDGVTLTLGKSF